jgi:hypothetical protein
MGKKFLPLIKHHTIKTSQGVEVLFLVLPGTGKRSSCLGGFTPGEKAPIISWKVETTACLGMVRRTMSASNVTQSLVTTLSYPSSPFQKMLIARLDSKDNCSA